MRGSEEQFQLIVTELSKSLHLWESRQIKHMAHAEKVDNLFASYTWDRIEFFKEINSRLGIQTNEIHTTEVVKKKVIKKKTKILPQLTESEKTLARTGSMVFAVKEIKNRLGIGLLEAKRACEAYLAQDNG